MKTVVKIDVVCKICGKKEKINPNRAKVYKYCSINCRSIGMKKECNATCSECGKTFRQRPNRMKRNRVFGFFCSRECDANFKRKVYKGEGNPNFKGVFKDCDGYPLQYIPQIGRIKEHLYITLKILGIDKIPKGYHIHHKDCNVFNNSPENLALLSISDHKFIHKNFGNASLWALENQKISLEELCSWSREPEKSKKILQTSLLNQIAVFKSDEFRESLEVGNPEPSQV